MALTDYDKQNLTKEQQAKVQAATDKWNAANAKGDTAGMKAAADEAAAVRNSAGYKTDSSGNYTGSYSSGNKSSSGSSTKNSQYTTGNYTIGSDTGKKQAQNMGIGTEWIATDGSRWVKENDGTITVYYGDTKSTNAYTPTDLGILGSQQVQAGLPYSYVEKTYQDRLNKIANDSSLSQYINDGTMQMMLNYINDQKVQEGIDERLNLMDEGRPEDYESKYDPRMEALLNEILNRKDFSYDVNSDPLYQQYAEMYQREGDRAMRETMSEAAANAGGMNTYAITAAQQAANYYNSQLNDRIPELYQIAYEMYLNDKESKVQDLGLLQSMDALQYSRYRDTMNDFYTDRSFAYGAYQDALAQGNIDRQFTYDSMINDRDYNFNREVWETGNDQWQAEFDREGEWWETEHNDKITQQEKDNEYRENIRTDENEHWQAEFDQSNNQWQAEFDQTNNQWQAEFDQTNNQWQAEFDQENEQWQAEMDWEKEMWETEWKYYDKDQAAQTVWKLVEMGVTPRLELITQAGLDLLEVQAAVEEVKKKITYSPTTYQPSKKNPTDDNTYYEPEPTVPKVRTEPAQTGSGNYQAVRAWTFDVVESDGKDAGLSYLKDAYNAGAIDQSSYMAMYNELRDSK